MDRVKRIVVGPILFAESYRLNSLPPEVVDMTQLNAQFINPADGKTVDYLKDFNAGDQVHFSDIIIDISYDATEDATTFYFTEDTYEENIGWKFAGNLLDQYSAGDVLNLTFDVLNVGNYQGNVQTRHVVLISDVARSSRDFKSFYQI